MLDVAIGVAFLYALLALIVTTLQELIASIFALRAKALYDCIADMLAGQRDAKGQLLAEGLYAHPLLVNLTNRGGSQDTTNPGVRPKHLPSYVPSNVFALALVDILRGKRTVTDVSGATQVLTSVNESVALLPAGHVKETLQLLLADIEFEAASLNEHGRLVSKRIEAWFNDRMARAGGWYKRSAQCWSIVLSAGVTVLTNADSIHYVQNLWSDSALRASVAAMAEAYHQKGAATADVLEPRGVSVNLERLATQLSDLDLKGLPIGWSCCGWDLSWTGVWTLMTLLLGWLITTLAVSLGAAFWFDLLGKLLKLRSSGPRVSEVTGRVLPDE
jgi:hypothetical protein